MAACSVEKCQEKSFLKSRSIPFYDCPYSFPTTPATMPIDETWEQIKEEAQSDIVNEPILRNYYCDLISFRPSLESALAAHLASKLSIPDIIPQDTLERLLYDALTSDPELGCAVRADLCAVRDRDPACEKMVHCFLYYKGFLALQVHRVAHWLWTYRGRRAAALLLQSRSSEVFAVDIHPGARIGKGILLDHATGVVIGETAVIGNDVSMLHGVTLGGTGKEAGDRHPKVGDGVLIGAGANVLGNVTIGDGAKIGAGAVVLKPVPDGATAVGSPAKVLEGKKSSLPAVSMDHRF
ncbi:Serine acetyltransferase [Rhynchospora pubera]|uniref:serine O-acetyltransferase n=1 Tax=Rhynchospora pubera TaxID=906938 RepID=A0AAV8FZR2_9POAL|nr:Serine acetyltransferase [Rhynchospora pubera]